MNLGKSKSYEDDNLSMISFRSLSSHFSSLQDGNSDNLPSQLSLCSFDLPTNHWDSSHSDSLRTAPKLSSNMEPFHCKLTYEPAPNKVTPGSEPIGHSRGKSISSIYQSRQIRGDEPLMVERHEKRKRLTIANSDPWTLQFENLKAFKRKYGHCMVPQKYPQDRSLGNWVNKQRMEFKKKSENVKSSMTDERVLLLEGKYIRVLFMLSLESTIFILSLFIPSLPHLD